MLKQVKVTNVSADKPAAFTVAPAADLALETVLEDREMIPKVEAVLATNAEDDSYNVYDQLVSILYNGELAAQITAAYAPEDSPVLTERMTFEKWFASMEADADDEAALEPAEYPKFNEAGMRELFGLSEDASLEAFLVDELGIEVDEVKELEIQLGMVPSDEEPVPQRYVLICADGTWKEADTYQAEILDTSDLSYEYEGEPTSESIIHYNFSVFKADVDNVRVRDSILYVPAAEVTGVDMDAKMYKVDFDEDLNAAASENKVSGEMTYTGSAELKAGDILAVYEGKLKDARVLGDVTYVEITEVSGGGKYAYKTPSMLDILFMPDVFPVRDDGSFEDGLVTVTAGELDFTDEVYAGMNLDEDSTLDIGDFIAFYKGDLKDGSGAESAGYGCITSVQADGDKTAIGYSPVTLEEILASVDLFIGNVSLDIMPTEKEKKAIENEAARQAKESGYFDDFENYFKCLTTGEEFDYESSMYGDALRDMQFVSEDGDIYTADDFRNLGNVEIEGDVDFNLSPNLKKLSSTSADGDKVHGIRAELTATVTVQIKLNYDSSTNKKNMLSITGQAAFVQELAVDMDFDVDIEWSYKLKFIPYISDAYVDITLNEGTYTGVGFSCTVGTTAETECDDFDQVLEAANIAGGAAETSKELLEKVKDTADTAKEVYEDTSEMAEEVQNYYDTYIANHTASAPEGGTTGGITTTFDTEDDSAAGDNGLADKYADFIHNDNDYINIYTVEVFKFSTTIDPLHFVSVGAKAYLFVAVKLNAMVGASFSGVQCKQTTVNIDIFAGKASAHTVDSVTPSFRVDFYVFGMIGIKAGARIDLRVGLFSVDVDSVGVVAEAGVYAEAYGFYYAWYYWSPKKRGFNHMGSAFFSVGVYFDLDFMAQAGYDSVSKNADIYEYQKELFTLGSRYAVLDFVDRSEITLKIPQGKNTVKLPSDFFDMKVLELTTGEMTTASMDSSECGSVAQTWTDSKKISYTQYNEENFDVTCTDHSFQYLPNSNSIYVKPLDTDSDTLTADITFTYVNSGFGMDTYTKTRTVHVSWEGSPAQASIEYWAADDNDQYTLAKTETLEGYEGIDYDIVVDDELLHKLGNKMTIVKADIPLSSAYSTEKLNSLRKEMAEKQKAYDALSILKKSSPDSRILKTELMLLKTKISTLTMVNQIAQGNVKKVISLQYGVFTFPMAAKNTVVKMYYGRPEFDVTWHLVYDSQWTDWNVNVTDLRVKSVKNATTTTKYRIRNLDIVTSGTFKMRYGDTADSMLGYITGIPDGYSIGSVEIIPGSSNIYNRTNVKDVFKSAIGSSRNKINGVTPDGNYTNYYSDDTVSSFALVYPATKSSDDYMSDRDLLPTGDIEGYVFRDPGTIIAELKPKEYTVTWKVAAKSPTAA